MVEIKVEEIFIKTPTGEVFCKRWTPESHKNETPLILIHDSLGSVGLWKDFPLVLSQLLSRTVIAYDRLGFGKSTVRQEAPSLDFITEEASLFFPYVRKALSIKEYILLGHSVGGGMAINIAAHDSDCKGVITMAAQAFVEEVTITGVKKAKVFFEDHQQISRLEKWHGTKAQWVLNAWVDTWLSPEFSNWSLDNCINDVFCPVLAIHGDKDEYGSIAFPIYIKEKVSGYSEINIIKDCGHAPHKEKKVIVTNSISHFLKQYRL